MEGFIFGILRYVTILTVHGKRLASPLMILKKVGTI